MAGRVYYLALQPWLALSSLYSPGFLNWKQSQVPLLLWREEGEEAVSLTGVRNWRLDWEMETYVRLLSVHSR